MARSLWRISTPSILAITGSAAGAGACANARLDAATNAAMPAANAVRRRRDAKVDRTEAGELVGGAICISLVSATAKRGRWRHSLNRPRLATDGWRPGIAGGGLRLVCGLA